MRPSAPAGRARLNSYPDALADLILTGYELATKGSVHTRVLLQLLTVNIWLYARPAMRPARRQRLWSRMRKPTGILQEARPICLPTLRR